VPELWEELLDSFADSESEAERTEALIAWMRGASARSSFLESLLEQYDEKGWLSPKQIETAERIRKDSERPRFGRTTAAAKRGTSVSARVRPRGEEEVPLTKPAPAKRATSPMAVGFYRGISGALYRVVTVENQEPVFRTMPADDFGGLMHWESYGNTIDEISERLNRQNVFAFGLLYGSCLLCGTLLKSDEDQENGMHAFCEGQLGPFYGYGSESEGEE